MRITNGMMADRVVFNTQRALQRFMQLQTDMSSGRRINKPSDDPAGTLRDLGYRTELSDTDQYQKNINSAQSWVKTYDNLMADMKDVMSSVKEIAIAMANGHYDAIARSGSATEVEAAVDHFMQLANSQVENRYILSGDLTQTQPFSKSSNGIIYQGDLGKIEFEISPHMRQTVNLPGSDLLLQELFVLGDQADLNVAVTTGTLLADLHNGAGIDLTTPTFTITDINLNLSATIDLTGAVTVNDALSMINTQLSAAGINNLTAAVADTQNALVLKTTPNGLISPNTLIARLNGGNGADMVPGMIRVTDGGLIDVEVDLSGSTTLADVMTAFNTQLATAGVNNVAMTIAPGGTALQITDSNAVPLGLSVTEMTMNEQTASQLGIVGSINPTLTGTDLNPSVSFSVSETTGSVAGQLGILGDLTSDKIGTDLDPRLTLTSLLTDLNNGLGSGLENLVLKQGSVAVTLDLSDPGLITVQDLLDRFNSSGLSINASLNTTNRGIQVANTDSSRSFIIEESGTGRTAKNLGLYGSSDMMGTLYALTDALRSDDQEGSGLLLRNLDSAIQRLLDSRAEIGSRGNRLRTLSTRLDEQKLTVTRRLSEVEDADITELITQLATHENNYRAALGATGRIIQPTLMDFLTR
ncbi:MAG: flagellar hook-associated protein FlgL [candidate division Zixibacteria bacterium]|nr:flagellar hook-associated protein FlgL [candidate division Zixibacteria bacterium]